MSILATDNFNRADGGLGANWTTITSMGAPQIATNAVQTNSVGTDSAAFYNGVTWPDDQYAQVTVPKVKDQNMGAGVVCRGSSSAQTFYNMVLRGAVLSEGLKCVTGTFTSKASLAIAANGDVCKMQVQGTTLHYYRNGVEDPASPVSDASISTGNAGIYVYVDSGLTTDTNADSFEGGDVLSRPVVLPNSFNLAYNPAITVPGVLVSP